MKGGPFSPDSPDRQSTQDEIRQARAACPGYALGLCIPFGWLRTVEAEEGEPGEIGADEFTLLLLDEEEALFLN